MHDDEETPWEGDSLAGAAAFARKCFDLNRSNPYKEALDGIINDLMTELWDNGFSQSEIRSAFEKAIIDKEPVSKQPLPTNGPTGRGSAFA